MAKRFQLKSFKRDSENIGVNYDYTDIASGIGQVKFYAGGKSDSTGPSYYLSEKQFKDSGYSNAGKKSLNHQRANAGSTSYVKLIEVDFDTAPFNISRIVNGSMVCEIPHGVRIDTSTHEVTCYIVCTIYQLDGATETQIGTTTSDEIYSTGSGGTGENYINFVFEVDCTKTKITRGQQIRINVQLYGKYATGSDNGVILPYSPLSNAIPAEDATGSTLQKSTMDEGTTDMVFYIPFDLDI